MKVIELESMKALLNELYDESIEMYEYYHDKYYKSYSSDDHRYCCDKMHETLGYRNAINAIMDEIYKSTRVV